MAAVLTIKLCPFVEAEGVEPSHAAWLEVTPFFASSIVENRGLEPLTLSLPD